MMAGTVKKYGIMDHQMVPVSMVEEVMSPKAGPMSGQYTIFRFYLAMRSINVDVYGGRTLDWKRSLVDYYGYTPKQITNYQQKLRELGLMVEHHRDDRMVYWYLPSLKKGDGERHVQMHLLKSADIKSRIGFKNHMSAIVIEHIHGRLEYQERKKSEKVNEPGAQPGESAGVQGKQPGQPFTVRISLEIIRAELRVSIGQASRIRKWASDSGRIKVIDDYEIIGPAPLEDRALYMRQLRRALGRNHLIVDGNVVRQLPSIVICLHPAKVTMRAKDYDRSKDPCLERKLRKMVAKD